MDSLPSEDALNTAGAVSDELIQAENEQVEQQQQQQQQQEEAEGTYHPCSITCTTHASKSNRHHHAQKTHP
jgi:hypothetical protein